MSIQNKKSLLTFLFVFTFILSAVVVTPAYADEATPPVNVPAETEPEETLPATPEVDSVSEESSLVETTETIIEALPEDTQVIIVDENGETLPLVTIEAQEVLDDGIIDPVWCPVGVAPQNGAGGCTTAYGNLKDLVDALMNGTAGVVPNTNGVIWIEAGADGSTGAITLNGTDPQLVDMENFSLTLQGGWNGTFGSKTISGVSTFSDPISITNWKGAITINNITVTGATGTGLNIATEGNVTISNSQFNSNTSTGLNVTNQGTIALKDVTANGNTNYGTSLDNDSALTPKAVTLSGTNTFNTNGVGGLYISTKGIVTANNLTANNNSGYGLEVDNDVDASVPNGVTLTGTNIFGDNNSGGLLIATFGPVTISNLIANSNSGIGVNISNSGSNTAQAVKITGTSEFKYNAVFGLYIASKGAITLNNVSANNNGQTGVSLINNFGVASNVTITGTNQFNLNGYSGLIISSIGAVTLNNLIADDNGTSNLTGYGVSIDNNDFDNFKPVTITGTNSFNDNYFVGLNILSSGIITLNNITANDSDTQSGAILNNITVNTALAPKAVIINGTRNTFSNNDNTGLEIDSHGAITLNNITAIANGFEMLGGILGADIDNSTGTTPQNVTIKGTNFFQSNYGTGLVITTKGAVITNSIDASYNQQGKGAEINNSTGTVNSFVTMTGTNLFSNNYLENLTVSSMGAITLNNITAEFSDNGNGATISNLFGSSTKGITLTGTNSFNSNKINGVDILSYGVITTNNLSASGNGNVTGNGALLYNLTSPFKAGVNINGINNFNNNLDNGLLVYSLGNVKINSVTAQFNGERGVDVDETLTTNTGSFTLTGVNDFSYNTLGGLRVQVYGAVTLNSITAKNNTGIGAEINNTYSGTSTPKPVTLLGTNIFSFNTLQGIYIESHGAITTNNITAINNTGEGAYLINNTATTPANVTVNGFNTFENNSYGLWVESDGSIIVSNITANLSANAGAVLLNNGVDSTPASSVILKGTNTFSGNAFGGLSVTTKGAITINNLTASNTSSSYGAFLYNLASGSTTPKAVTLTGTNAFNFNGEHGLIINSYGSVAINNLTANYNGGLAGLQGTGVVIDNNQGGQTIAANVTLTGYTTASNNYRLGIYIESFGTIKIHNLTANDNGDSTSSGGAYLDNSNALSNAFGVTLSGNTNTISNGNRGLEINSKGAVLLNNVTSTENTQIGLYINNVYAGAGTPKPVTLTGVNNISNNSNTGFSINSHGVVTLNKITANSNIGLGGGIDNASATTTPANVVVLGYGVFNSNSINGLVINSLGTVTVNNITSISNTFSGLDINNSTGTGSVILNGVNNFAYNGDNGVTINSSGAVSITKIASDSNSQSGLVVTTTGAVTITCGSLNLNSMYGWEVYSATLVTVKGVFTGINTLGDYFTASPVVTSRACPLP